jgi:hypothetical protein
LHKKAPVVIQFQLHSANAPAAGDLRSNMSLNQRMLGRQWGKYVSPCLLPHDK